VTIYLFLFFSVFLFGGISYLVMLFFKRWTQKSKYETLWNTLVFIASFALILFVGGFILISNLSFER
jgi:phosphate starvation-inducible membrane PsiE